MMSCSTVMAGLVSHQDVDARYKAGHDVGRDIGTALLLQLLLFAGLVPAIHVLLAAGH
jgi:hypothetical protein